MGTSPTYYMTQCSNINHHTLPHITRVLLCFEKYKECVQKDVKSQMACVPNGRHSNPQSSASEAVDWLLRAGCHQGKPDVRARKEKWEAAAWDCFSLHKDGWIRNTSTALQGWWVHVLSAESSMIMTLCFSQCNLKDAAIPFQKARRL